MTSHATVTVERHDRIAVVRLTNPPVNALTSGGWRELATVFGQFEGDQRVGAVVLTGHPGRLFSAGQDVEELQAGADAQQIGDAMVAALAAIERAEIPVVAAVHRAAIGGGMLIAAAADCIVCTADTTFSLPEVKMGIIGGYSFLAPRLPRNEARWMALSGEPITGTRAHQIGFAQRLVDTDDSIVVASTEMAVAMAPFSRYGEGYSVRRVLNGLDAPDSIDGFARERDLAANHPTD